MKSSRDYDAESPNVVLAHVRSLAWTAGVIVVLHCCAAWATPADPAVIVEEPQGRESFVVNLTVGDNRVVGTIDVGLILETDSSLAANKKGSLSLTLKLGGLTRLSGKSSESPERLADGKASDLEWSIVSGHVSFAYDDAVGECLGPVTMWAYDVSKAAWTEVTPPSKTQQTIAQLFEATAHTAVGWLVPPASMAMSGGGGGREASKASVWWLC